MNLSNQRIQYIDAAKGLGMILIIFGHSIHDGLLNNWIHSFHVPMFFLISGFFLRPEVGNWDFVHKKWKQIGKALLVTHIGCFVFLGAIFFISTNQNPYHIDWIIGQLFFLEGYTVPVLWFLYALIWGQLIAFLSIKYCKKVHLFLPLLLFLLANRASDYAATVPFCVVQGVSSAAFVCLGFEMKDLGLLSVKISSWTLLIGLLFLLFAGSVPVFMSRDIYPLGIWNVLLSTSICYIILSSFCKWSCCKMAGLSSLLWKLLCHFGRFSLIIMCLHCIEMTCQFEKFFMNSSWLYFSIRLIVLGTIPLLIERVPFLKSLFVR